ncbi:MAG TPA: S8 family serine peptidase [Sedimentisphaerales bacterium]|nr:S8 family serine peptidase [Sedimentisphaerales bacterium]
MRSTNSTKEAIKQWLHVSASPETRDRIWREVLFVQEESSKTTSALIQPNIWRTIMKSPLTKIGAAAVIIISVVFLITFFDKAATPAYALEQTIEANHTIKTVHLRMFEDGRSIENNEFSDYWIKYNDAGMLSNLRCNEHDKDGVRFTIWNEGIKKTWIPEKNVVFLNRLNNTDKAWEDFAKEFEPKFRLQWLYDQADEKEALEIKIDEPAEDSNSIYVKATHSVHKVRAELVVDRKTKLIKKFSIYHLREQEYELDMRFEFLAYNQPIDPSMFELSGIPDNAKVYDQVNQLVGLEKGDLTNEEIAVKVVREGLKATIAKDYGQVRKLMEGDPGDTIEEFIEKEFEARLVRIVSIGRAEEHEKINRVLYFVPCEIEVENEERGRWIVNIIATATAIEHQDNRWIMHTDFRVSEPYILSTKALNEQDRIEGNIIVPGLRVGDYTFDMSKDEVLKRLGGPKAINYGGERYTLNNLPTRYYMVFDDVSFRIVDDSVKEITVLGPSYQFTNGLGVGDSEQKIKQAFGDDFQSRKEEGKDYLCYDAKGLAFEIHKKNQTVAEIVVYQPEGVPRVLRTLPKYDPDSTNPFQMDLRCRDLSKLDLTNSIDDLLYATFDDRTVWPAPNRMPSDFTWQKIMELGKNPGLGIRSLHKKGITGHGVSIAILDQPLLVDHQEYAERLRLYEEIHIRSGTEPQMHGPAVASIAVGKTVGVAPEAELYYISQWNFDWEKEHTPTLRYLAQGIHRIVAINEQLPKDKKIRVISISKGWTRSHKEYKLITEAAQKARAAGMLVVCTSVDLVHDGCDFGGLGRSPLADPEVFESYEPGLFMVRAFSTYSDDCIWVPMDSRTTASPCGIDKYVFYRQGGFSWAVPYIAGVYALAVQVDPAITPEKFWSLAMQTGRTIELDYNGKKIPFGPIIDPVRLIRAIQAGEPATSNRQQNGTQPTETHPQTHSGAHTIVPGVGVGDYTLDMSKDDVLKKLGEPRDIFLGEKEYTLDNLPRRYFMSYGDVSFAINDDSVTGIGVHSPLYKFTNGLAVGDSEDKIKQAFGNDFQLEEFEGMDVLIYEERGLRFEIDKKTRTVDEISVTQAKHNQ